MSRQFFAERAGRDAALTHLGITAQENPFLTDAYVSARQKLGGEVWILGTREGAAVGDAAVAVLRRGRLSTSLEIPSLPISAATDIFWQGVYAFCKRSKVTDLEGGTFGSSSFELPPLKGETSRTRRIEFVVPLRGATPAELSSNHKRNVKKATAAGLVIRRSADPELCLAEHHRLMGQSLGRRSARGEHVPQNVEEWPEHRAFLEAGSAEIFQVLQGETVLSSVLVLRSARAGYYESAGTSPEGMGLGASHFLIHAIGERLRTEGAVGFNLGGAEPGSSLARFKAGFGATEVPLEACTCYVGPGWRKKLRSAYTLAREDPRRLRKAVIGGRYKLLVYAIATDANVAPVPVPEGTRFAALSEQELTQIAPVADDAEFRERQLERLERFGKSYAFGVFQSEVLAHISWLLPAEALRRDSPRILQLRADEAEITACETLPQFRGRNLYPYAVQQLLEIARQQGIRRVYMKTREDNVPSQSGIVKGGLTKIGTITVITPPLMPGRAIVLRRLGR